MLSHLGKTRLIDEKKIQALIRRRAERVASDQSLDFLSHTHVSASEEKHFLAFCTFLKQFNEFKHIENTGLGKHFLLLRQVFADDVTYMYA